MKYYQVKQKYDGLCINPRIHNGNVLIGGELYTEKERQTKLKCLKDIVFNIVEIPKNKTYFFFGARYPFHSERGE